MMTDLTPEYQTIYQTESSPTDAPPKEESPLDGDDKVAYTTAHHYDNSYDVVTLMMYLTGVQKRHFDEREPNSFTPQYEKYQADKDARLIRALCTLRTTLIQYHSRIVGQIRYEMKNLSTMPEIIPQEALEELSDQNIDIQNTKPDVIKYIITLNTEISNRINNVKHMFPDWVKWDYIRPLFLMNNGYKPDGVKAAENYYNTDRNRYPYQCWINWHLDAHGNIFNSDYKFMTLLYSANHDTFEDRSLIRGTNSQMLGDLYKFVNSHDKVLIVVDCENSDPIKLAAAFTSMSMAQKSNIHKIMLFDSDYTTPAWTTLCDTGITREFDTEHIVVPRIYDHKSQVDMTLAVSTSKEVYQNDVDAVILVSSDSDYWALIKALSGIDFLVMLEKMKSGQKIRDVLESEGYRYCFIDDFCTGASYSIKTNTILNAIQNRIDGIVNFNVMEMLNEEISQAWLSMTEKEKQNFYDRYLKHMQLKVATDGAVRLIVKQV